VSDSPNPNVINLMGAASGPANIYGNIVLRDPGTATGAVGDVINVVSGETDFDGIINPQFMPAGGVTADDLDTGLQGIGTLNINSGGALYLMDPYHSSDYSVYD